MVRKVILAAGQEEVGSVTPPVPPENQQTIGNWSIKQTPRSTMPSATIMKSQQWQTGITDHFAGNQHFLCLEINFQISSGDEDRFYSCHPWVAKTDLVTRTKNLELILKVHLI